MSENTELKETTLLAQLRETLELETNNTRFDLGFIELQSPGSIQCALSLLLRTYKRFSMAEV